MACARDAAVRGRDGAARIAAAGAQHEIDVADDVGIDEIVGGVELVVGTRMDERDARQDRVRGAGRRIDRIAGEDGKLSMRSVGEHDRERGGERDPRAPHGSVTVTVLLPYPTPSYTA